MRSKLTLVALATIFLLAACKKDNTSNNSTDTTLSTDLAGKQAIADYSTDDAFELMLQVGLENNLLQGRPGSSSNNDNFIACANVTISSGAFPKTVVIDFGDSCTAPNGIVRKGKINILVSNYLQMQGSTATMTFDNYYVSGFKKEGNIVWTNQTAAGGNEKWSRTVTNGKITAPGGAFWLHNGTYVSELINNPLPNSIVDNVWSISGSSVVSNSANQSRNFSTITPLVKKAICRNIVQGQLSITGGLANVVLDYGNGDCDNLATITLPSGTFNITLP